MKITVDVQVFCTCGMELRVIRDREGDHKGEVAITVAPCDNPECRQINMVDFARKVIMKEGE